MNLADLTPAQRNKLLQAAANRRDYFARLRDRMKATGWPEDAPLFVAVCWAWDAAHEAVKVVYLKDTEPTPRPEWMQHIGVEGAEGPG